MSEIDINSREVRELKLCLTQLKRMSNNQFNHLSENNGYTNYPTWCVGLWLDNEQAIHEQVNSMATANINNAFADENYTSGIWNLGETVIFRMEDELKEYVSDLIYGSEQPATMQTDLTTFALSLVNWRELAINYIELVLE